MFCGAEDQCTVNTKFVRMYYPVSENKLGSARNHCSNKLLLIFERITNKMKPNIHIKNR